METPRSSFRRSVVRRLWMVLGGLAIAIAFLDGRAWPLAWVGLLPLFALTPHAARPRSAFVDGWIVGVTANGTACAWLIETIDRFGGFPLPVALFFYGSLIAFTGLPFALVGALLRWAGPRAPLLLAPALWVSGEFLFPNFFPWRLAYTQRDLLWLNQIGDVTGPYGLSFVMAWFASAASRAPRRPWTLLPPLVAAAVLCVYGVVRTQTIEAAMDAAPAASIGIVQGNLSLVEKRQGDLFQANVERYRRLSRALEPVPDLIVWPETVVGWSIPQDQKVLGRYDPFPDAPAPLVFGSISHAGFPSDVEWFNSAFLRRNDGSIGGRYDKLVLMPFGEFLPFSDTFPWIKDISPNSGDFTPGRGPAVLDVSRQLRVGALVCYDDMLAGHVREAVRQGATLLLTVANDAWFGDSAALRLHESLGLWRAIENRRYFVRATNTGLSSVIDPLGRVTLALPTWIETAENAPVRLLEIPSPYQEYGDLFAWSVVALALVLLLYSRSR